MKGSQSYYRLYYICCMVLIDKNMSKLIELCERHMVKELFLFGSILTDKFSDSSDIDMLIRFSQNPELNSFTYKGNSTVCKAISRGYKGFSIVCKPNSGTRKVTLVLTLATPVPTNAILQLTETTQEITNVTQEVTNAITESGMEI